MGFFKSLFGGKKEESGAELDDYLMAVDPLTGFEHDWSDEKRKAYCFKALEKLKADFGGELKKTEDELRLYTEWKGQKVTLAATWYTGELTVSIVGGNTLGPFGLLRDESLDEGGEMTVEPPAEGWADDSSVAGAAKHYVGEGIYLETTQEDMKYERERLALLPDELRQQIIHLMQTTPLQTIFTTADGVDCAWEMFFFRVMDFRPTLGPYLDVSLALYEAFATLNDPDPNSTHMTRCPFCHLKVIDSSRTKCENCGGNL